MKIEIELNDLTHAFLIEMSKEHNVSPDEIVDGLIVGFGLRELVPVESSLDRIKRHKKIPRAKLPLVNKNKIEKFTKTKNPEYD